MILKREDCLEGNKAGDVRDRMGEVKDSLSKDMLFVLRPNRCDDLSWSYKDKEWERVPCREAGKKKIWERNVLGMFEEQKVRRCR